jgi:recombination protein RecT
MENQIVPDKPAGAKIEAILRNPKMDKMFSDTLKENKDAFVASIIDLYSGDNYLQRCDPTSVAKEALKAATLKLPVNKSLGFAYIVPYASKGKVNPTMQIGYKGYIQLAMRTGQYRVINADMVYEGELRSINKLTGEIDFSGEKKSDKVIGYFAHIELLNGFTKTLYMTRERVLDHAKKYSKSFSQDSSPWKTEFDAMAQKTVIRNLLSHYGYLSVEMIGAISEDTDEREDGLKQANTQELPEDVQYEDVSEMTPERQEPDGPGF